MISTFGIVGFLVATFFFGVIFLAAAASCVAFEDFGGTTVVFLTGAGFGFGTAVVFVVVDFVVVGFVVVLFKVGGAFFFGTYFMVLLLNGLFFIAHLLLPLEDPIFKGFLIDHLDCSDSA